LKLKEIPKNIGGDLGDPEPAAEGDTQNEIFL
jgi:hypothetical protein